MGRADEDDGQDNLQCFTRLCGARGRNNGHIDYDHHPRTSDGIVDAANAAFAAALTFYQSYDCKGISDIWCAMEDPGSEDRRKTSAAEPHARLRRGL